MNVTSNEIDINKLKALFSEYNVAIIEKNNNVSGDDQASAVAEALKGTSHLSILSCTGK